MPAFAPSTCEHIRSTRRPLSPEARREKVINRMRRGSAPFTMRWATRWASVLVLPAVGEIGPSAPDRAGLQERLELRCEDGVAVIDRVLRITDQMGEAEPVRVGVCALRR